MRGEAGEVCHGPTDVEYRQRAERVVSRETVDVVLYSASVDRASGAGGSRER